MGKHIPHECEECKFYCQVLGLNSTVTTKELQKRRRAFAEVLHPDQLGSKSEEARHAAEEQLKRINEACDHMLRCRADHNSTATPVREDAAAETGSPAGYQAEPTAASSEAVPPMQDRWDSDQGSSGAVWRYSKVSLRAIWRSTKAVFVLALALLLSAIMFMGLIVYLKDYWDRESRRSRGEVHGGVGAETLFGFLNGIMWLPRHIWCGLMMMLSGLTIAAFVAGRWFVNVATENLTATVMFASICGFLLLAWAFLKERRAEFDPSLETARPKTISWVMGIVVMVISITGFIWWNPSFSSCGWRQHCSTNVESNARSLFGDNPNSSQASVFAQSATEQSSQTSESLPDQVLWDIKRPEALHRSAPIGDFQVADAMEFLFGKYDSQGRSSKWTGIKSHALGFQADTGTTSPYFDAEYNEGGVLKHVLLTATTPDVYFYGCHLCSPLISIFVFANRDGKWIPEREAHVENLSSWGKPPAVKLQRIGAEEYGVVFSTDDLAQGQYSAEDILMVPRTASSVELLKIITKASNNGACGGEIRCYLEYSTYRFEPNHDHKLFDVIVTESGTKWKDRTVVPADGIAHYEYRNGEYVVTQSPTELVPDDKSGQPIGAGRVTVDCSAGKLDGLTIYAGPQSSFPVVGRVTCDEVVTVLSPKDDNDWFRIRTSSNVVGFVWMFLKASGS